MAQKLVVEIRDDRKSAGEQVVAGFYSRQFSLTPQQRNEFWNDMDTLVTHYLGDTVYGPNSNASNKIKTDVDFNLVKPIET